MTVATTARNDFDYLDRAFATQDVSHVPSPQKEGEQSDANLFGEDGFGFDDFLDIINPLQHIPVISSLYREITGDELSPGARVIGGGIFGGGIGLATSVVNSAIEMGTGKDLGEHVIAMFKDDVPEDGSAIAKAPEQEPQKITKEETAPTTAEQSAPTLIQAQAASPLIPELVKANAPSTSQGLEWKKVPPNLQQGLEKLQQSQGTNLSEEQMSRILGSFGNASKLELKTTTEPTSAPAATQTPTISAPKATEAYSKPQNVSDSYSYLDSAV